MPYRRRIQVKKPADIVVLETFSEKIRQGFAARKTPLFIFFGGLLFFGIAVSGYFYFSGLSAYLNTPARSSAYLHRPA